MATIKSYTDLQQSRKLAEFLPLESADMYYPWYIEEDGDTIESGHRITTPNVGNFTTHKVNKMILPCWSLAALLGVTPGGQVDKLANNKWEASSWDEEGLAPTYYAEDYDNPIDACYELILKLNELNLL